MSSMSRPGPEDPIAELSHDHSHLGVLVQAVRDAFVRVERGEIAHEDALQELEDGAEALREGLLVHFGREEEALFPFVEARLPRMVALTANAFAEDRERCLAAGLDDYLAKPFQQSELTDLLTCRRRGPTEAAA